MYCLIECDHRKSFGPVGIGGQGDEVYTIPYRSLSGVVSETPLQEYEPDEKNALAHIAVIQRVMQEHTVLPLRFCTIFRGEASLRKALRKVYHESRAEFDGLRDRVEMGVKVLWPPQVASSRVRETSSTIREMEERVRSQTPGVAYLLKLNREEAVKDELNRRAQEYAKMIYENLSKYAVKSCQSRLVGHMIFNGAFLVDKGKVEVFKGAAEKLGESFESEGLDFVSSGPWPPYNFVSIKYE